MTKRMLIDGAHPEEIRIVVANDSLIEELDHETSTKNQNKGNIYLAKVMRVEPSLRAAFVDYGNNRHGFLPFSEIHPNYFQIPVSDKEKLLNEDKSLEQTETNHLNNEEVFSGDSEQKIKQASIRRSKLYSKYKIQEVIKKRQILLIQVTKEERGNKGAALTTFISLAGRYCVLMPNSTNAGGISRKISFNSRKKMKDVLEYLSVPKDMSVILRTAGSERTKIEIKRDLTYLTRLWNQIRNQTLKSIAPILIHEENHIIKRAIRDHYTADINEVYVEGEEAYKLGKSFMKILMPSKSSVIKKYKNSPPLFSKYGIEKELELIHKSEVRLKSGGSLVINPTEALVAIDINSGKSTSERDIEATALKTNLEASAEIARQLKLRDLAGLIVIDYIDMNIRKNNHTVENSLKQAVRTDRAKIQIGRISMFGLMEMSRQRMRPSLLEINYKTCNYCNGIGLLRSTESQTLLIFRSIEQIEINDSSSVLILELNNSISEYIFNKKRQTLLQIEKNKNISIEVTSKYNMNEDEFTLILDEKIVFSSIKPNFNLEKYKNDLDATKTNKSKNEHTNLLKKKKQYFNKNSKRWKKKSEPSLSNKNNSLKEINTNTTSSQKTKDEDKKELVTVEEKKASNKSYLISNNEEKQDNMKSKARKNTIKTNKKNTKIVDVRKKDIEKKLNVTEKKSRKKSTEVKTNGINKNKDVKKRKLPKNLSKNIKTEKKKIKREGWWQKDS